MGLEVKGGPLNLSQGSRFFSRVRHEAPELAAESMRQSIADTNEVNVDSAHKSGS